MGMIIVKIDIGIRAHFSLQCPAQFVPVGISDHRVVYILECQQIQAVSAWLPFLHLAWLGLFNADYLITVEQTKWIEGLFELQRTSISTKCRREMAANRSTYSSHSIHRRFS